MESKEAERTRKKYHVDETFPIETVMIGNLPSSIGFRLNDKHDLEIALKNTLWQYNDPVAYSFPSIKMWVSGSYRWITSIEVELDNVSTSDSALRLLNFAFTTLKINEKNLDKVRYLSTCYAEIRDHAEAIQPLLEQKVA